MKQPTSFIPHLSSLILHPDLMQLDLAEIDLGQLGLDDDPAGLRDNVGRFVDDDAVEHVRDSVAVADYFYAVPFTVGLLHFPGPAKADLVFPIRVATVPVHTPLGKGLALPAL